MAVTKKRALNIYSRNPNTQDLETKKYSDISNTATATEMKSAVQNLYSLSRNTYYDGEIVETYSLNEAAADEEG